MFQKTFCLTLEELKYTFFLILCPCLHQIKPTSKYEHQRCILTDHVINKIDE